MWMRVSTLVALAVSLGVVPHGRAAASSDTITGTQLVARLRSAEADGADVDLTDLTVTGPVDLTSLRTITRPLRCRACRFEGQVRAADVVFGSLVELVEATFEADVDARGATFEGTIVLDRASFERGLDLTGAQFGGLASFESTNVDGPAVLDRAVFGGRAVFTGSGGGPGSCPDLGAFNAEASFRGATFLDAAAFRQRCFASSAHFDGASFAVAADFSLSDLAGTASFERVVFRQGVSFAVARFGSIARFENASLEGRFVATRAEFAARAAFSQMTGTGVLHLDRVTLPSAPREPLSLNYVTLGGLVMDLDLVPAINDDDDERTALALIESTARADGHAERANEAHYRLLVLENALLPPVQRTLDGVFYRRIAGYLVKPLHPLACLGLLAGVGALVRLPPVLRRAWRRRPPLPAPRLKRLAVRSKFAGLLLVELGAGFFGRLFETVGRSWSVRDRPSPATVDPPGRPLRLRPLAITSLRWTEWLAVKVLVVVTLLAIANANPTIRTLVESVF